MLVKMVHAEMAQYIVLGLVKMVHAEMAQTTLAVPIQMLISANLAISTLRLVCINRIRP